MELLEPREPTLRERIAGLTRRRVTGDLLVTAGSRWVQMLVGLVGSVVSARTLGPSDFGLFGIVISVIMVFGTVADAGLTYSAIRLIARHVEGNLPRAQAVARAYFRLRLLSGVSMAIIGIPMSWPLAGLLGYPTLVPYLQLAFLTLLSLSLSSYPNAVLVALARFKALGVASVLNSLITVGGILVLYFTGTLSLATLIAWNVILPLVSSLPSWFVTPTEWMPWKLWRVGDYALRSDVRHALVTFGKWMGLSLVATVLVTQGDVLLLGLLATPATVGVYSVALALATRLDTLNQSLFTILMPRASRLVGIASIRTYWRQVALASVGLAVGLGVVALLAQPVILWLYGEKYEASAGLFLALLGVVLFDLATSSLFLLVFPLNRPRLLAAADWLRVGVFGVAGFLLIPVYGAFGAVAARFMARVTGTTMALLNLRRAINEHDEIREL